MRKQKVLFVVALLASLLIVMHNAPNLVKSHYAAQAVEASGGEVYFDFQRLQGYTIGIAYRDRDSLGLRTVIGREFFGHIEAVDLGPRTDIHTLELLSSISTIRYVFVDSAPLTVERAHLLSQWHGVTDLWLFKVSANPTSLRLLARMRGLKRLRIVSTTLDRVCLDALAEFTSVEGLEFDRAGLKLEDVANLQRMLPMTTIEVR